ncbi:MAG: hypothetical protein ACRC1K_10850 [Planctomycetia bacterium]
MTDRRDAKRTLPTFDWVLDRTWPAPLGSDHSPPDARRAAPFAWSTAAALARGRGVPWPPAPLLVVPAAAGDLAGWLEGDAPLEAADATVLLPASVDGRRWSARRPHVRWLEGSAQRLAEAAVRYVGVATSWSSGDAAFRWVEDCLALVRPGGVLLAEADLSREADATVAWAVLRGLLRRGGAPATARAFLGDGRWLLLATRPTATARAPQPGVRLQPAAAPRRTDRRRA